MPLRSVALALSACALALTACGSDEEPEISDATPDIAATAAPKAEPIPAQDDEAIRAAIGRYYTALIAGDTGTVCGLMSEHAKRELEQEAAEAGNAKGSCEKTTEVYAGLAEQATLEEIREVELEGDRAKAEVEFSAPFPDQDVELVRGGADGWLVDEAD